MIRFYSRKHTRFFCSLKSAVFGAPRLVHRDSVRAALASSNTNAFLEPHDHRLSNSSVPQITWFDGFDRVSSGSDISVSSVESSFLDELLRSSVFSDAPNNVQVPTTVDSSELGGLSDHFSTDNIESLDDDLLNIADVTAHELATDTGELSTQDGHKVVPPQRRSAMLMKAMLPPAPAEPTLESVEEELEDRPVMPIDLLMDLMSSNDIERLVKMIGEFHWPSQTELGKRTHVVMNFIVRNSRTPQESLLLLSDFCERNNRTFLSANSVLELTNRYICEVGIAAAVKFITTVGIDFLFQQPAGQMYSPLLTQIYNAAFATGDIGEVSSLHETMLKNGFCKTSDVFMETLGQFLLRDGKEFSHVFTEWSQMSTRYATTSGLQYILDAALMADVGSVEFAKRIKLIINHCQDYHHPYMIIAHLVCSLIRSDKVVVAEKVLSQVAVSGRHFLSPLREFSDLKHMEQFANLTGSMLYGERSGKKKATVTMDSPSTNTDPNVSRLLRVLRDFYGKTDAKPKFQTAKRKHHRPDEKELTELALSVVNKWIHLAAEEKNTTSAEKILAWTKSVRVVLPTESQRRLSALVGKPRNRL